MAVAPGSIVQTTTNQYLAPFFVDGVLRDNYFFGKLMQRTEKWNGVWMLFPLKYQKGISSIAFNGYDLLPITQQPTAVNETFYPTFIATNISLAGSDLSVNDTEMQTLKLMQVTMDLRAQDAADDVGNYLQGDGTADGGKAPNGLANTVDDGTVAPTYGGLSRSAYNALNATVTPSNGSISLFKVRTLWNNISDGPIEPDFIVTDYNTWALFESLQVAYQRNNADFSSSMRDQTASTSGYSSQRWDGMEIGRDKKITSGNFYMLNMRFTKWYSLKWWKGQKISPKGKDVRGNVYEDTLYDPKDAFTYTGLIEAYNQGTVNSFMILGGQFISQLPFRNGVLTGITTTA